MNAMAIENFNRLLG